MCLSAQLLGGRDCLEQSVHAGQLLCEGFDTEDRGQACKRRLQVSHPSPNVLAPKSVLASQQLEKKATQLLLSSADSRNEKRGKLLKEVEHTCQQDFFLGRSLL